jgi:WD40 repeat protein
MWKDIPSIIVSDTVIFRYMIWKTPKNWLSGETYHRGASIVYATTKSMVLPSLVASMASVSEASVAGSALTEFLTKSHIVKVINMSNAVVHEFTSHIKSVIALAILRPWSIVMSCSLDHTIRLFNLQTFKEIYR